MLDVMGEALARDIVHNMHPLCLPCPHKRIVAQAGESINMDGYEFGVSANCQHGVKRVAEMPAFPVSETMPEVSHRTINCAKEDEFAGHGKGHDGALRDHEGQLRVMQSRKYLGRIDLELSGTSSADSISQSALNNYMDKLIQERIIDQINKESSAALRDGSWSTPPDMDRMIYIDRAAPRGPIDLRTGTAGLKPNKNSRPKNEPDPEIDIAGSW